MKLVDLAKKAISLLQEAGEKGYNNIDLAQKLHMPRRRVYDIIAILRAANMVEAGREKGGTRIKWLGIANLGNMATTSDETSDLKVKFDKISSEKEELTAQVEDLKDKIQKMKGEALQKSMEVSKTKTKFEVTKISIRTVKTAKFTKIQTSPIEIILEADKEGFVVEPG